MQLKWYLGNNPSSIPPPCCKRQFTPSRKCQYTTNTNNYAKWDNNMFYIFVLSKFCKNYREKKILYSDKILRWKFVVRIHIDFFCTHVVIVTSVIMHSCIKLISLDIDDLLSVICFLTVKSSVHFQCTWFFKWKLCLFNGGGGWGEGLGDGWFLLCFERERSHVTFQPMWGTTEASFVLHCLVTQTLQNKKSFIANLSIIRKPSIPSTERNCTKN